MRARPVDILGIGQNATDTVIELPRYPAFDSEVEFRSARVMPGGQIATAAVAGSIWGLKTRYIGRVGDDAAGELHRRELKRHRVEFQVTVVPHCASQSSYILVDGTKGERTILFRRDARLGLRPSDVRKDWVLGTKLVLVDGHNASAGAAAARLAKRHSIITMADLDHIYPGIPSLLRVLDYPVTSRTFPGRFTGQKDLLCAMQDILGRHKNRAICSTLGAGGAVLWEGARFWYAPAYRVRAVDTTGAGDVFHAAFAYGLLQRWDWQRIMDFSCAAAGLNCEALGARGGIRPLNEIERLRLAGSRHPAAFSHQQLAHPAQQTHRC